MRLPLQPAPGSVGDAAAAPGSTLAAIIAGAGSYSSGLDSARPAASSATIGSYYYATDSRRCYLQTTASAWTVIGVGDDRATFGPFSTTSYLGAPTGATNGPTGHAGTTWLVSWYQDNATPAAYGMLACFSNAALSKGWWIATNPTNYIELWLAGINGGTSISPYALATGPHSLAITYKADGTACRHSLDGAAVQNSPTTGTRTLPDSSSMFRLGSQPTGGGSYAYTSGHLSVFRCWETELADADLRTLSGSPTSYKTPLISTPSDWAWEARWHSQGSACHEMPNTVLGYDLPMYLREAATATPALQKRSR